MQVFDHKINKVSDGTFKNHPLNKRYPVTYIICMNKYGTTALLIILRRVVMSKHYFVPGWMAIVPE